MRIACFRGSLLALILVAVLFDAAAASSRLAMPSSNLLFQLEKQNRSHPWFRVTTDSARVTLKARRIDELGLSGLTAPDSASPPPASLTWAQIERIDEVVTRAHQWRVASAITAGLLGAGLGNAIGAPGHKGGVLALVGFVGLGSLGGVFGGDYGERFQHERNWYDADTSVRVFAEAALTNTAPAAEVAMPPDVIRVANRIGRNDVIRLSGDFGKFQGFADAVGPEGLKGLRVDRRARNEWANTAPPARVPWAAVDEIQVRGGAAGKGALIGAANFAVLGAVIGAAAVAAANGNASPVEGGLLGAVICAPFGALLGAAAGAGARHWVIVYRRP